MGLEFLNAIRSGWVWILRDGPLLPCCLVALNPKLVVKVGAVDYPREILYKK